MSFIGYPKAPYHGIAWHALVGLDQLQYQTLPGGSRELLLENVLQLLDNFISAERDEATISLKEFI